MTAVRDVSTRMCEGCLGAVERPKCARPGCVFFLAQQTRTPLGTAITLLGGSAERVSPRLEHVLPKARDNSARAKLSAALASGPRSRGELALQVYGCSTERTRNRVSGLLKTMNVEQVSLGVWRLAERSAAE